MEKFAPSPVPVPIPQPISAKGTEDRRTENKTIEARGLTDRRIQRIVEEALEPNDKYFFNDLVDAQSRDPVSPQRAAEIRARSNLYVPNVRDVETEKLLGGLAMLGFQALLTVAMFHPLTALPANAVYFLFALGEGSRGSMAMAMASMLPIGRMGRQIAQLVKMVPSLQRAAATLPRTMKGYKTLAGQILRIYPRPEALKNTIEKVPKSYDKAVEAAREAYKTAIKAGKPAREAASEAGTVFHKMRGAAGQGMGVDFATPKFILEVKTHYNPILDKWVIKSGHDTVLAYVLKDLVEKRQLRNAIVEHVFINPKTGEAVRLVVNVMDDQLMKLLRSVL